MYIIFSVINIDVISSPPTGVSIVQSSDRSSITVSWDSASINDLGAFFVYRIKATPLSTSSNRRRQAPIIRTVPYNTSTVTLMNIDPSAYYNITVLYVTQGNIEGPPSPPFIPGKYMIYKPHYNAIYRIYT